MDKFTSDKLRIVSFVSIIMVLYIHSGFHEIPDEIQGMKANIYLQEALSGMLGRTAVPMFFMISGMLFFRNICSFKEVQRKMKRRVRTLCIPFLIAGLFLPIVYLVMYLLPWTDVFVNSKNIFQKTSSFLEVLQSLYLFEPDSNMPWGFHLWFLRNLIIIVACSPILYLVRKRIGGGIMTVALFAMSFIHLRIGIFTSMFWFMAGDWLLLRFSRCKSWLWLVSYFVLCAWQMLMPGVVWDYVELPVIMIGVIGLWSAYDIIVDQNFNLANHKYIALCCQFTFFIYLYHEPTINILRKFLIIPLGRTSLGFAVNYLLSPWVFVLIMIPIGVFLRKYSHKFYEILVGGR